MQLSPSSRPRARAAVLVALVAALVLPACNETPAGEGGDAAAPGDGPDGAVLGAPDAGSPGGACAFTACGGDVRGTWTLQSSCLTVDPPIVASIQACPTASIGALRLGGSNVSTFAAGGTYQVDATLTLTSVVTIPPGCASAAGSCAALAGILADQFPNESRRCDGASGGGCTCEVTGPANATSTTGTYTTAGTELVTTPAASNPITYDYCVAGNTLTVRGRDNYRSITVFRR